MNNRFMRFSFLLNSVHEIFLKQRKRYFSPLKKIEFFICTKVLILINFPDCNNVITGGTKTLDDRWQGSTNFCHLA